MDEVKRSTSRSYGQFCALARALDVVGDRWNLLIVRELLPGPLRYGELKSSLAGIATNLLSERLKSLESNGIVERRLGEPGVVYALTRWGSELREPMEALGRWGAPLLASGRGDDSFHPRWLVLAIPALLQGATADPPVSVGLEVEGYLIDLHLDQSGPRAIAGLDPRPRTILSASPDTVVALAAGAITVDQAIDAGHLEGGAGDLRKVFRRRAPKT
ncbi:HxlR family transcriptional regulator [Mycolicibacterium setense]|uniref:winged helix-turn-helix transcriptional regulator n=1 Tax=Mycolicibacterium setense TaxID=431269 RepID=UPI0007E9526F|nr:helix-turn-helix domain-containing protein [Mycolicibacterium setense]OBB19092.1 HxlR family transcriptional regulator [Mycolicibacterium setense]